MANRRKTDERVEVLISSWLDRCHAERIAAAEPDRITLMYEPDLLPTTRYEADHHGPARPLTDEQRARWCSLLARAEVSFDFDWEKPAEMTSRAPRLRWVQSSSSGIGPRLDALGVSRSDLIVTNAAGIHAQPLAEFVIMSALYFAKEMPRLMGWKAERHWERYCGYELSGTRMLIVGVGGVGRRVAELASAFGVEVVGHRRSRSAPVPPGVSRIVDAAAVDDELPATDFLVMIAPETPLTRNMIDRRRLELLPKRAVIINIGRGSTIDEVAMTAMLADGRLRGAALDVFAQEPLPQTSALWGLPNVIIVPHSASTVCQENDRLVALFIDNLHRYLDGRPMVNTFDRGRMY
jgi:phosphoglycerate dehydrogenase-like enzyme